MAAQQIITVLRISIVSVRIWDMLKGLDLVQVDTFAQYFQ